MTPDLRAAWRGGVRVAGTGLGLDVSSPRGTTFLSSAAAPLRRARQIVATAATHALAGLTERGGLAVPCGRPFALGKLRLELFPTGLCPGAAGLLVERDGVRLAYAGRVGDSGGLGGAAEARPADVLVIDGGAVERRLPDRAAALAAVCAAIAAARAAGETAVLVADPFLAGAELAALLGDVPLAASHGFAIALRRLAALGHAVPAPPIWGGEPGVVVLWSGAAPPAGRVLHVGAAAALSWPETLDAASFPDYARSFGARRVYVTSAAGALPAIPGVEVLRLGPPEQLRLDLPSAPA